MNAAENRLRGLDADLLTTEFRINDPENSVEFLSRSKPAQDGSPQIIGYYNETPAGGRLANAGEKFIWCCHCQKETHWRGYLIEDGSAHRFTIGNKCGHDHYGAEFGSIERSFNEQRARKGILRSFWRLSEKVGSLSDELDVLLSCPFLAAYQQKTDEMFRVAPKAFGALKRAVSRGRLRAVRKWRNKEAEDERSKKYERAMQRYLSLPSEERRYLRDEGLKPEPEDDPIYVSESADFGFVTGTGLLGFQDPRREARDLKRAISRVNEIVQTGTDNFPSKEIAIARREVYAAATVLRSSLIEASMSETFFDQANLERISNWSDCFRGFSFEKADKALIVSDEGKPLSLISFIKSRNIVAVPSLDVVYYTEVEDDLVSSGEASFLDPDDPMSPVII